MSYYLADERPCDSKVELLPVVSDLDGTASNVILDPDRVRVGLGEGGFDRLYQWFIGRELSVTLHGPYFTTYRTLYTGYFTSVSKHRFTTLWSTEWHVKFNDSLAFIRYVDEVSELSCAAFTLEHEWACSKTSIYLNGYSKLHEEERVVETVRRHAGGVPGDYFRISMNPNSPRLEAEGSS